VMTTCNVPWTGHNYAIGKAGISAIQAIYNASAVSFTVTLSIINTAIPAGSRALLHHWALCWLSTRSITILSY
jgi:hypothetical protein